MTRVFTMVYAHGKRNLWINDITRPSKLVNRRRRILKRTLAVHSLQLKWPRTMVNQYRNSITDFISEGVSGLRT